MSLLAVGVGVVTSFRACAAGACRGAELADDGLGAC